MSINLGPVGPSSMSVSSDIYSEIGPPLRDSSLSNHETQRNSPPIPPRPVTSRQENLYDVPETDDARSITSHTYTLPADARGGTTISSTQVLPHNTAEWLQHTSNTRDSWFGQCSPILVIQQRCSTQADVLNGIPTRDSWFGQCSPILVIQQRCWNSCWCQQWFFRVLAKPSFV